MILGAMSRPQSQAAALTDLAARKPAAADVLLAMAGDLLVAAGEAAVDAELGAVASTSRTLTPPTSAFSGGRSR